MQKSPACLATISQFKSMVCEPLPSQSKTAARASVVFNEGSEILNLDAQYNSPVEVY